MVSRLVSFLTAFSRWCHEFGSMVVLPAMALIITVDVGARYFFNAPLPWGEEVNGLLLFLVLMLSMTFAWDQGRHIRMELVYVHLRGRWRLLADVATGVTGIVFFGFLGVQSFRDIDYMRRTNEATEVLQVPLWPFRALLTVISLVFVGKLLHFLFVGRKAQAEAPATIERDGIVISRERN
jgi:TRAP-type transport system small permease protein